MFSLLGPPRFSLVDGDVGLVDRGGDNDDAILGQGLFGNRIILAGESQRKPTIYDAAIATLWNI